MPHSWHCIIHGFKCHLIGFTFMMGVVYGTDSMHLIKRGRVSEGRSTRATLIMRGVSANYVPRELPTAIRGIIDYKGTLQHPLQWVPLVYDVIKLHAEKWHPRDNLEDFLDCLLQFGSVPLICNESKGQFLQQRTEEGFFLSVEERVAMVWFFFLINATEGLMFAFGRGQTWLSKKDLKWYFWFLVLILIRFVHSLSFLIQCKTYYELMN